MARDTNRQAAWAPKRIRSLLERNLAASANPPPSGTASLAITRMISSLRLGPSLASGIGVPPPRFVRASHVRSSTPGEAPESKFAYARANVDAPEDRAVAGTT